MVFVLGSFVFIEVDDAKISRMILDFVKCFMENKTPLRVVITVHERMVSSRKD